MLYIRVAYTALYRELSVLVRVLQRFDELFRAEKNRRGILEYSDIERYTYECLWQNGELTDVAQAQRQLYRAIYIDEYQDVNELQNKIFEAVANNNNRFMVGDIKQSIYGFRSAKTDIFASMKKSFCAVDEPGKIPKQPIPSTIFMSENFRCDKGVVDFVNDVFDKLFYHMRDSIGYLDGDKLKFGKGNAEAEYKYPEICVVDKDAFSEQTDKKFYTPTVVAQKIKELLDNARLNNGERVKPGDIAIIMRTAKGREGYYKSALEQIGIEAAVADDTSFFMNAEVLLALCLLNVIDNPRRDIYLTGLLCSPLYSFTPDDMVLIKSTGLPTLYECLEEYTVKNPDFEKGASFLRELAYYRMLSEGMPTDELLSMLFRTTGLFSLAAARGSRDNLYLLYENARRFEGGSYKGLYNFITYINSVIDRNNSFDKREAPQDNDKVRIITVHSSKGLEFPIVFLVGAEENITRSYGAPKRYVYKEDFGIGLFARTPSGLALVENPTKAIINDYIGRVETEEAARVLYVALTRAREQLYVVATPTKARDKFLEEIEVKREFLDDYSVYSLSNYLEFILASGSFMPLLQNDFITSECGVTEMKNEAEKIKEADNADGLCEELCARFTFNYPDAFKTALPEKVSVSKLYPAMLDGTEGEVLDLSGEGEDYRLRPIGYMPSFITKAEGGARESGIATHLFLQFCSFDRLADIGAERELENLVHERFIGVADAALVRLDEIEAFTASRLFKNILGASKLYRELRFNVRLPAEMFTSEPELRRALHGEGLLVQGVIDCLWVDSNGEYHLIDYKTDRLTDEELEAPYLAARKLKRAHSRQLGYYKEAVKIIFGKYPVTTEVYSLPLGNTVDVDFKFGE